MAVVRNARRDIYSRAKLSPRPPSRIHVHMDTPGKGMVCRGLHKALREQSMMPDMYYYLKWPLHAVYVPSTPDFQPYGHVCRNLCCISFNLPPPDLGSKGPSSIAIDKSGGSFLGLAQQPRSSRSLPVRDSSQGTAVPGLRIGAAILMSIVQHSCPSGLFLDTRTEIVTLRPLPSIHAGCAPAAYQPTASCTVFWSVNDPFADPDCLLPKVFAGSRAPVRALQVPWDSQKIATYCVFIVMDRT